jgi:hypothetical protein
MEQKTKDILLLIGAQGSAFINPTSDKISPISAKLSTIIFKAESLHTAIMATLPEPIPPETGKIIPAKEQGWLDSLDSPIEYAGIVNSECLEAKVYLDGVVSTYSETVGLHSTGANVIEEVTGGGIDTFNVAYSLIQGEAVDIMTHALFELNLISDAIPNAFDEQLIEDQISALDTLVGASDDYSVILSNKMNAEIIAKAELVVAAKNYVLAIQVQSWSNAEHTKAILDATGSAGLKEALIVQILS